MASNVTVRAQYRNGHYENPEALIRKFKKKCEKANVLKDLRKHEEYVSPSVKRRLKSKLARQRQEKELAKKMARMNKDK